MTARAAYKEASEDPEFEKEYLHLLHEYVGRPTELSFADRLTDYYGGAKIYLKREDLCHTGAQNKQCNWTDTLSTKNGKEANNC